MMKKFLSSLLIVVLAVVVGLPAWAAQDQQDGKIPDLSFTPRQDVPVEYTWKVDDIYPSLAEFEKDKAQVQELTGKIDELAKDWTGSPQKMLNFLEFLGNIRKIAERLYAYVSLNSDVDLGNSLYQQLKGQLQMIFVQLGAKLSFMNDDILKLGQEKFAEYLKQEPGLSPYAFSIEQVLRMKEHVLPADQQRLVTMTGMFSGTGEDASKMLNDVEIPGPEVTLSDGKKVTLNFENYTRYRDSKNAADRALVIRSYWKNHKQFENTLAILLNGEIKAHLFNAQATHFKDCLAARLFGENIDAAVYHNLIKSTRENLAPLHRYLNLRKELLGLEKHKYEDIYASAVAAVYKSYSWDEARDIILKAMKPLGEEYVKGLETAFNDRWIDRYSNKGKETGAYSSGVYGVHPYIKMNYNGTYDTLTTLAHELGHSMHSYFSYKTQHYAQADYPTFLAEIASTFNENMVLEYLIKTEKNDLFKLYILDEYLNQFRGTVYRQTLFSEFELAIHQRVEEGKSLTPDWLNQKYLELTRFYYGHDQGVMEVGDFLQVEWSSVPHFFLNYYVFNYSTGLIASQALTEMVLHGKKADKQRYLDFLSAGGSRFPLDTLKLAGIDMTTDAPAKAAFKRFNDLVAEMEKIVKRLKKQGKL